MWLDRKTKFSATKALDIAAVDQMRALNFRLNKMANVIALLSQARFCNGIEKVLTGTAGHITASFKNRAQLINTQ
jgi:hypothetical protein